MNGTHWTDPEIVTLKRMYADGKRCAEIGRALGRSVSSIRIKATRLRLTGQDVAFGRAGWPRNKLRGPRRRVST